MKETFQGEQTPDLLADHQFSGTRRFATATDVSATKCRRNVSQLGGRKTVDETPLHRMDGNIYVKITT